MTIKDAIKKAQEGGWDSGRMEVECSKREIVDVYEKTFLDLESWRSLGKSFKCRCESHESAEEDNRCRKREHVWNGLVCRTCGLDRENCPCPYGMHIPLVGYEFFWHRLIGHLANRKTAESFFESL
jgi:hypothetical protein